MLSMDISEAGVEFIEGEEGFRGVAYRDGGGVWTIGDGETKGVYPGETMTRQQATALLKHRLVGFVAAVNHALTVKVAQAQFDALVSFAYNAWIKHAVYKLINALADLDVVIAEWSTYVKDAKGAVEGGLVTRREKETAMFRSAPWPYPQS